MIQPTSTASYHEEKKKGLSDRHAEILEALLVGGPMTDRELQNYLSKNDANDVRPRRNELTTLEYGVRVKSCEKRKCRVTGKTAFVWALNDAPPVQFEMFPNNNQFNAA